MLQNGELAALTGPDASVENEKRKIGPKTALFCQFSAQNLAQSFYYKRFTKRTKRGQNGSKVNTSPPSRRTSPSRFPWSPELCWPSAPSPPSSSAPSPSSSPAVLNPQHQPLSKTSRHWSGGFFGAPPILMIIRRQWGFDMRALALIHTAIRRCSVVGWRAWSPHGFHRGDIPACATIHRTPPDGGVDSR